METITRSENMELLLENTDVVVAADTGLKTVNEVVEAVEDNKKSKTVAMDMENVEVLIKDDATESVNEIERQLEIEATNDDDYPIISVVDVQTNIGLEKSVENIDVSRTVTTTTTAATTATESAESVNEVEGPLEIKATNDDPIISVEDVQTNIRLEESVENIDVSPTAPTTTTTESAESVNVVEGQLENEATNDDPIISVVDAQTNIRLEESAENIDVSLTATATTTATAFGVSVNEVEGPLEIEATNDDPIISVEDVHINIRLERSVENIDVSRTAATATATESTESEHQTVCGDINICDDGEQTQTEVKETPVPDQPTLTFPATIMTLDLNIQFGSFGHDTDRMLKDLNPETEPECFATVSTTAPVLNDLQENNKNVTEDVDDIDDGQGDGQRVGVSVHVQTDNADDADDVELRPCCFSAKVMGYEDENLNEEIINAELQLDEKIRCKDAISDEMHIKWERNAVHYEIFLAKTLELRAARKLVKSKRQQIAHVQRVINAVENAAAVEDIDSRISKAEDIIKHGKLCFEDEKQFVREIKQLKSMRVQLAANMGRPDESLHMFEQKDRIQELLKKLNTKLKTLKLEVSKAQVASYILRKKYLEELEMVKELRDRFVAAKESCKQASARLHSLKQQLNAKVEYVPEGVDRKDAENSGPGPNEIEFVSAVTNLETQKSVKSVDEHTDDQVIENVLEEVDQKDDVNDSGPAQDEIEPISEVTNEAHERKKRVAEKILTRAETKAQQEAQQQKKKRLKRMKKKEKKRAAQERKQTARDAANRSIDDGVVVESHESSVIEHNNGNPPAVGIAIKNKKPLRHWGSMVITVVILILSIFSLLH